MDLEKGIFDVGVGLALNPLDDYRHLTAQHRVRDTFNTNTACHHARARPEAMSAMAWTLQVAALKWLQSTRIFRPTRV